MFNLNTVMESNLYFPERDNIQFKPYSDAIGSIDSYSAYWVASSKKEKFETYSLKFETNQLEKIMIDPTSNHF